MAQAPQPAVGDAPPPAPKADSKADANRVECITTGSFFENDNFTGKLLQAGETVTFDKDRAHQLRAAGLVKYTDEKAEKEAAGDDAPPGDDQGQTVTITRRRPKE